MAVEQRRYSVVRLRHAATGVLAANPALVPALLAVGVFVALGASEAGFDATGWYAAALFLLGLLVASLLALRVPRGLPRPVLAALALFAAYTAWTYLSITWASQQGPAWDGANRTAMYLIVFALFALWPFDGRGATAVLGLLGLGIAGVGLVELLKANGSDAPAAYFIDVRFAEPAGYMNANVALWTMGLLPCLFLATRRAVPAPLRGLALGGAGLLAGLALLGQSRGWVLALPLALAFFLAVSPGRVRLLAATAAVALAALAVSGPVLAVHDDYSPERFDALLSDATGAVLLAALVLAAAGTAAALLDRRVEPGPAVTRRVGLVAAALVAIALVGGVAAYAAAEGSPTGRIAEAWRDFKEGGEGPQAGGSRFAGGGTNRYDFWTVAWDAFREEPLRGIGVENFQEEYLLHGESGEQPRYAHSLELGALSQTGVVGGLLLLGAIAAALAAALRVRAAGPAERAAAAAAAALFAYWILHASVDWFWEFAALTGPAFAALGMAGALAPRLAPPAGGSPPGQPRRRLVALVAGGAGALLLAASFALPWLAEREVERATEVWRTSSDEAFRRLDRAADLNPLSPRAQLTEATIALRVGRTGLAKSEFREALRREPSNVYALLELGALAGVEGERAAALRLLRRARALSPRDQDVALALRRVLQGNPLPVRNLNRRILERARLRGAQVED
jgi:tetratricopeptide (TPR) repeat protein